MDNDRSINFDEIADLYDLYVTANYDIKFFLSETSNVKGRILELTSGTGRISIPLLKNNIDLTCVDYSEKMLSRLLEKADREKLHVTAYQMDITELSLPETYSMIYIPFQSVSEIADRRKHLPLLSGIRDHLADTGTFICTLHNPAVKIPSMNGSAVHIGKFPMPGSLSLDVSAVMQYDNTTQLASGTQIYSVLDNDGDIVRKNTLNVRFYLFSRKEFESLADDAGFSVMNLYGDYDYSGYQEDTSPYMIWKLKKR